MKSSFDTRNIDMDYVSNLQRAEQDKRKFSRVPNMAYSEKYKQKYMFPVPKELVTALIIVKEQDRAYRALIAQELRYCIKNQSTIQHLAERTYKRVLLGKNVGLVVNSCDFLLLEQKCVEYHASRDDFSSNA